MKSFQLTDSEIDVIRHALKLLDKDCHFDIVTFTRHDDFDSISACLDTMSCIAFLLNKIKF